MGLCLMAGAHFFAAMKQKTARITAMIAKILIHLKVSASSSFALLSSPIVKKTTPAMKIAAAYINRSLFIM